MDTAGSLATFVITCGWIFLGLIAGVAVISLFWGWPRVQKTAFPFIDELKSSQAIWESDLNATGPPTAGRAIRQAGLAIAFAILSGFTISGVLDLIGQLATPAG